MVELETISAKRIDDYLYDPNFVIIDLRSQEDYDRRHVQGAINIPYERLPEKMDILSRNLQYILYCERGSVSLVAAKEMSSYGYIVKSVVGGIHAYRGKNVTGGCYFR